VKARLEKRWGCPIIVNGLHVHKYTIKGTKTPVKIEVRGNHTSLFGVKQI